MDFVDLKTQYRTLKASIDARIQKVLDHGQYVLGPEVAELEQRLAAYVGAKARRRLRERHRRAARRPHGARHQAGRRGDHLPVHVRRDVEVIMLLGAKPVLVDVQADTCNLDPSLLERAITPRARSSRSRFP